MKSLIIDGKEYKAIEKLNVTQWMDIAKLNLDDKDEQAKAVCIVFNIPVEMAGLLTDDIVAVGIVLISDTLIPEIAHYKTKINKHTLIDFNKIDLGKFIDLEVYLHWGKARYLDEIVKLLYGADNVSKWNIDDVLGAVIAYDRFRAHLFTQYRKLFEGSGDDEERVVEIGRVWYDIIMTLADGKFNLIEQTINRPVIEAFNWLAWNKDRIRKEQQ